MSKALFAIGEVSKRTGMPVKTLRFYADEGVVPPSGRSASGYRLYAEADVVKLELVRSLRDAGLGLDAIRSVLGRDLSLSDALRLRLGAIEAHITSLQQVAAALRVALRSEPTEQDIRRLTMVTRLSEQERKNLIESFQQRLVEGIPVDHQQWMREKMAANAPRLPDDPTPEQLDAWVELAEMMSDASFVESMREHTREAWSRGLDLVKLQKLNNQIGEAAQLAQDAGTAPESTGGRALVDRYLAGLAELSGQRADDPQFRSGVRQYFDRQDPRKRYWQLVSLLNPSTPFSSMYAGWGFVVAALRHHLPAD